MPTGYTADVAEGKLTDFRTFALRCARNFGATVTQRDEPMDALPRLREESSYAARELPKAEAELARLAGLTYEQAMAERDREHAERVKLHERLRAEAREKRERYSAMLDKVRAWQPPTPAHGSLKDFMISQLTESIKFDCSGEQYFLEPLLESTENWLERKLGEARRSVVRLSQDVAEERMRVAQSNAWIQSLWASLPPAE